MNKRKGRVLKKFHNLTDLPKPPIFSHLHHRTMNNTCFVLDKPASEFSLTLYYTCNGGVDESTFSNDTSNNIIFSSWKIEKHYAL